MRWLLKHGFILLLLGVMSDFLTPYILSFFYPKMNQLTTVISVFGDLNSPTRKAFNYCSIISGILLTLSTPAIYSVFSRISPKLAFLLAAAVAAYGIFDCFFTGVFSVDTAAGGMTLSTLLHNVGSAIGYAGFLFFPLVLFLLYRQMGDTDRAQLNLLLLTISLFFAGIYGLARVPHLNQIGIFKYLGLWQRVSFLFNYLPMFVLAIDQLKKSQK